MIRAALLSACLVVPPLAGALLVGRPLAPLLALPPLPSAVQHAPFSWSVFFALAALVAVFLTPYLALVVRIRAIPRPARSEARRFPAWGWAGLALVASAWYLAWTRQPWFAPFQHHTFTPLWIGYIVVVNAWTFRRTGRSLLTHQPGALLALFPLSAGFWWLFEWLNRFVGNWHYVGVEDFSPIGYVAFASLAFATVLPAVLSTLEWLRSFSRLEGAAARHWPRLRAGGRRTGRLVLVLAVAGSTALAVWPEVLFPLVWVTPLLAVAGIQQVLGEPTPFAALGQGDWRPLLLPPLAALLCGFFWEMWNVGSLAHWVYSIPYVQRFHLFEMPTLGYAGYFPFGLECLAAAGLLSRQATLWPSPTATVSG